jgi:hypothetical protein
LLPDKLLDYVHKNEYHAWFIKIGRAGYFKWLNSRYHPSKRLDNQRP